MQTKIQPSKRTSAIIIIILIASAALSGFITYTQVTASTNDDGSNPIDQENETKDPSQSNTSILANFSHTNIIVNKEIQFTDTSQASSTHIITQWSWNFGDGTTSTQQNPTHTYQNTGMKTIKLTVFDSNNQTSTTTKPVYVAQIPTFNVPLTLLPPFADFSISTANPTVNQQVYFTDQSYQQFGIIESWHWNFGDGTTSTQQNPTHAYSAPGIKTATLTATDEYGFSNTVSKTINVEAPIQHKAPSAGFSVSSVNPTLLQQINFTDTSTAGSVAIINWLWNFGDGTTSTLQNPTHYYSATGMKTITLVVTDSNNKTSTVTHELNVTDFTMKTLIWSEIAWSASDMRAIHGSSINSPVLEVDKIYQIEVSEMFWYNYSANLGADAMYYTTNSSNDWNWNNSYPAPDGHSFLQINGEDVNWGSLSNGDTGHTYTINYIGQGQTLAFQIVDWMDDNYDNNYCHLPISIYLVGTTTATGLQ